MSSVELTILMPCLNEEETVGICIKKAKKYLEDNNIIGEVLIVDNDSTDHSREISKKLGARVILEKNKGYGNAIRSGLKEARGKYIIYGDCDDSYDFINLNPYMEKLKQGYSFVNGNRFKGKILEGAMSPSHKIGVKFLSYLGRKAYKVPIYDFHCGLRGLLKKDLPLLETEGMEYATEIIYKYSLTNKKICEIPICLRKDGRSGKSHLRTIRDGFRHLIYINKTIITIKRKGDKKRRKKY